MDFRQDSDRWRTALCVGRHKVYFKTLVHRSYVLASYNTERNWMAE